MEYCRSLRFEQEPSYKTCLGFFEGCMARHNFDGRVFDYTWKQNRLQKDKEALKNSMLTVINKKPKAAQEKVQVNKLELSLYIQTYVFSLDQCRRKSFDWK
jgi:hypothetical protein